MDKFALPDIPTHKVEFTPPKGTKFRTGEVKPNFNQTGGGQQFELILPKSIKPEDLKGWNNGKIITN